jgi:S-adenosylmethionine:tRNA ribosyltransferase-isomerase
VRVAEFDFDLPRDRIAQRPTAERDGARLLVLDGDRLVDSAIRSFAAHVPRGALVVVNDTRVVAARLFGTKVGSGGRVELFLLRCMGELDRARARFEALGRASKGLREGAIVDVGGELRAEIVRPAGPGGVIEIELSVAGGTLAEAIDRAGHVPLPPYIDRADDPDDRTRYQTVFARNPGAVAAPTAGLHLSDRVLADLSARDVRVEAITLHVGLGTFQPVTVEDLDEHAMHAEHFTVPETPAQAIAEARAAGAPVIAIGTTVARALESARDGRRPGFVRALAGETRLLIQPGYEFGVVDLLLTNFHLPRSTLLALVSALGGKRRVLAAYRHAVEAGYRFFSYGDAMLVRREERR